MDSKPPTSRRFALRVLPAAGFSLLVLVVYADPVFTRRNFVGRDLLPYGLPLEKMVHDAYARGGLPVWSEDLSGGRPLLPNPNAGALYPIRPLLSRLPFPLAMRLLPVIQWALAGVGMIVLLPTLGVSPAAAWVGAVTYVFSGIIVSEIFYVTFQPATAFHPWIVWALAQTAGVARRAVLLGFLYGLLFLLGDVFAVFIALLASLLWIAFEVGRGLKRRSFAALGIGLALGGLLAAPQVAATALLAPETQRAVTGIRVNEALAFTLSPWRLAELVVPYPFGDSWAVDGPPAGGSSLSLGFFVTLYPGAFAVVSLVALWTSRRRGARFARALFLAGVLLATVFGLVPAGWGARTSWVPLRFPEKFVVAAAFALAVLAGLAFDRFRESERLPAWILYAGVLLTAAAATVWSSGARLAGALAEAGLLWVATLVALELLRRPGPVRLATSVALLTIVPIAANRRIAHTENEGSVFTPTLFARELARRDPQTAYRAIDVSVYRGTSPMVAAADRGDPFLTESRRNNWSWAVQALWRRGTVFNLDPDRGDFSRVESLRRVSGLAAQKEIGAPFFAAASLRFGIRYRDQPPLPGFRRFGGDAFRDWDENPDALPDLRLLERWREEPGALPALQALPQLSAGEVVLETERRASGAARAGALRVEEKSPERLILRASSPDPGWLFVLRGYWRYRTILVDGERVEAVPAQLAFSAIPLSAGEHRIEWREEVPGLSVSRWGPAAFALAAGGLLVRKRPEEAQA